MVLPGTTKVLIDDVIGQGRSELLWLIAGAAGLATIIQAISWTLKERIEALEALHG